MSKKTDEQLRSDLFKHSQRALDLLDESDLVHRQLLERHLSLEHTRLTSLFTELQSQAIVELSKSKRLQKILTYRQRKMIATQKSELLNKPPA